jgi:DNA transposition AAA+ family ATPase
METTKHMHQRMAQRGISRAMVDLVLAFGEESSDRCTLGRDEARRLLAELQALMRITKKVLDKQGVTVVLQGNALITTYNRSESFR